MISFFLDHFNIFLFTRQGRPFIQVEGTIQAEENHYYQFFMQHTRIPEAKIFTHLIVDSCKTMKSL